MLKRLNLGRGETIEVKIRGLEIPMILRRSARARRFSLQVSEARRGALLTMPLYSSFADADEFLSRHLDWLKERVAILPDPVPFADGAIIPLRGFAHVIRFAGAVRRRGVVWVEEPEAAKAAPAWPAGARVSARRLPRLHVSGEKVHASRRLLDWLKRQAHLDLKARVDLHARRLDLTPKRIYVRDQTTRWGSCSTSGALSFSWRLLLAPPFVLDYLAAHEVAHLAHMNHGPRFWSLVARTMPRHEEARNWLRKYGSSLHAYGAEGMHPSSQGRSPKRSIE
ncbi:MAG: M48 family metallopeptidase [Methyloceanibacter sp.]|uniref:M48 family metallopeptidase n=1 Tax=Methyloceanibacter sp. TaxID=1965321 RepID=UPI003D6CFD61